MKCITRATYQLQKLMENIHVEDLNNSWRTIFRNRLDYQLFSWLFFIRQQKLLWRLLSQSHLNLITPRHHHWVYYKLILIFVENFVPSNRGNGRNCLETPRRRTKLVRKAKCEAKMNFLTGEEDTQQQAHVADVADKTGNGLDTLHSMPILRDQSKTRRQTPPDINCDRWLVVIRLLLLFNYSCFNQLAIGRIVLNSRI